MNSEGGNGHRATAFAACIRKDASEALRRPRLLAGLGAGRYLRRMPAKSDLQRLAAAVRAAEQELDGASGRSALNAAAKRLMRVKAELKAAEAARAMASCVEALETAS